MPISGLTTKRIKKVWGRRALGLDFFEQSPGDDRIGEIWFETDGKAVPALLVKYLFTSDKLSVQVHPDDRQAQARGHRCGKEECWLILDADPQAKIGIGPVGALDEKNLREAALDGSIEAMLDWKHVAPGDFFYLPAGTIHAIGAGVTLLEVQQNIDLTYRLYDYGRPRPLHLDDAVSVARLEPWVAPAAPGTIAPGREILAAGRKLVLERWTGEVDRNVPASPDRPIWAIPLEGSGESGGERLSPGSVWLIDTPVDMRYSGTVLIAYPGNDVIDPSRHDGSQGHMVSA